MFVVTIYIMVGMTVFTTIIEIVRRQYAESWRKMQELRAQIQAQLKLADTLKKISEAAGQDMIDNLIFSFNSLTLSISLIIGFDDMNPLLGKC